MGIQDRDYMRNRRYEKSENKKISKGIRGAALRIWKILWITFIVIGSIFVVLAIIGANVKSVKSTSPSSNAPGSNSTSQNTSQTDKEEPSTSKSSPNNNALTIITEEKFKIVSLLPNALRLQLEPNNSQFIAVKYKRTSANGITLKIEEFEWVLVEAETSERYIKISPDLWKILGPYYPNLNLSNPAFYVK